MHDANGTPLKEGDRVLIPAKIIALSATEGFCNVGVETTLGRRPDGEKERFTSINTGVLIKASGDDGEKYNRYNTGC